MERQFQINWQALILEAKQRRKKLGITQERLAALAGVSMPTISHFENGDKDIRLSSVNGIIKVLGLLDERILEFPESKPRNDYDRELVLFVGRDRHKKISCAISKEALEDHFGGKGEVLKIFSAHQEQIEHEARKKYLADRLEPDGTILIHTTNF